MNEIVIRYMTTLLALLSAPALVLLIHDVIADMLSRKKQSLIEITLLIVYITFLLSSAITVFINMHVIYRHASPSTFLSLSLFRNLLKHIGMLFISWSLYFITQERK